MIKKLADAAPSLEIIVILRRRRIIMTLQGGVLDEFYV